MLTYFKNSFAKFKQDALSKALYDILKYVIIVIATIIIAKFIPNNTSFGSIINKTFNLSVLNIFLTIVLTIAFTLLVTILYTRKKYNTLKQDNFTDELTGMLNHKALKDILPKTIDNCKRQNQKLSLIIIDIDDFKIFNKNYNYQIADKVLTKVGDLLKSDSRATDFSFRQYFKGDEFIILAKETELANAVRAAERKRNLFRTGIEVDNQIYHLTVSCGVTEFNFATDTEDSALARINNALQIAKAKTNKNCVEALV
jgi:diguanylate cyclase (GGDEF)-like protein